MERCTLKYLLLCVSLLLSLNTTKGYNPLSTVNADYVSFKVAIEREDIGVVETICFDETVFINLTELMDILGYPCLLEAEEKKFSVCCPTKNDCLTIHRDSIIRKDTCTLFPDSVVIYDSEQIFLRSSYLAPFLGIESTLVFQSLKLIIKKSKSFPVLLLRDQEVRRKRMLTGRENIKLHQVDTLPLSLLRISSLGYALTVSSSKEGVINSYSATGSMNTEFLKGSLRLNYSHSGSKYSTTPDQFTFKQSYSLDKKWLKQVSFFRDYSNLTLNIGGYGTGVYMSNDNTSFFNQRQYLYKGRSRPNENVEVYNNKSLVGFVTADSIGYYEIIIPVFNGINDISAVTFSDYGESVSDHTTIYMPLNMEPYKKIRYSFNAGYSDDSAAFTGLSVAYGLTQYITTTGTVEAMIKNSKASALIGIGVKFAFNTALQGGVDYYPGVKYTGSLTGNIKQLLGYSVSYEKYNKDQTIIYFSPLQKIKMSLTTKIPLPYLSNSVTLSAQQINYKSSNSFITDFRWNLFYRNLSSNINISTNSQKKFALENPSVGLQLGYRITNRIYYDFNYNYYSSNKNHRLDNRIQYQLADKLSSSFNVEYQTGYNSLTFKFGITYRLPWMTVGSNASVRDSQWSMNNSVSGGVNLHRNNHLDFSNQSLSGASLHVALYVDKNGNETYDKGETVVQNAKVMLKTGANISQKKGGVYFRNIAPDHAFKLTIPRQAFRDISWQIAPIEKALYLAPYQSRSLYFPVKVISEITGCVFTLKNGVQEFLKNIVVEIRNINSDNSIKLLTDEWGTYSYLGITTGEYEISIISEQVKIVSDKTLQLTIPETEEGEQLEGLDFEVILKK